MEIIDEIIEEMEIIKKFTHEEKLEIAKQFRTQLDATITATRSMVRVDDLTKVIFNNLAY